MKVKIQKFQIDQSGKIEQTSKNTVLCLANSSWDTVLIRARTKRQIQEIFRRNGQIRNYVLFTFCAGLSVLIKRNLHIGQVTIDREYFGKEPVIKELILKMLKDEKIVPDIYFALIGKQTHAHYLAKLVADKKKKSKIILKGSELIAQIKKTEVGNRLKDA